MLGKFLVIGCGSIGRRHLRNLKTLGVEQLAAFDPSAESSRQARTETGAEIFDNLERALAQKPAACFVCSPSSLHVEHALAAARNGCHLFIEKPLSHNWEKLDELQKEIEKRGLISLVGCNMRFHPGPQKVKQLLCENAVGRVLFAQIYAGSYLPEWRPQTDYRQSYSGRADLGGGAILDCIHEIDLAFWYSGKVGEVFGIAETLSLPIETEDMAFLLLKHQNGILSEVHLDYVQRTYQRGCQIIGEAGTMRWDFREKKVELYRAESRSWETFAQPENWEINEMYLDETRHFLACLQKKEATIYPVSQAAEVLRIALAAKESAQKRSFIELK